MNESMNHFCSAVCSEEDPVDELVFDWWFYPENRDEGEMWDQQNVQQWHCLQSDVSPLDDTKPNISAWNVDLILSLLFQQNRLSRKQDCDSGVSVCQGWGEKQHVFQVRALISSESPLPFPLWVKLWRLTRQGVTLHYSFIFLRFNSQNSALPKDALWQEDRLLMPLGRIGTFWHCGTALLCCSTLRMICPLKKEQ